MHVFVTGASGFVGSAIVRELLDAGHTVTGLARSDSAASRIAAAGAAVHRGSLEDLESLRAGAAAADGVIHTAFNHDFMNDTNGISKFAENGEVERRAIEALGSPLAGSARPLIVTSGVALLAPGRTATEDDVRDPAVQIPRDPEGAAGSAATNGVRVSIVRLPPCVHGDGEHFGLAGILIAVAREKGASAYVGDGRNRWSAVNQRDAAHLYRLALERGAAHATYHAVGDQGLPLHEIATLIGRRSNVPVVSKTPEEAADHFGWFAHFAATDASATSEKTRAALGWRPTQPGLIADLEQAHAFAA